MVKGLRTPDPMQLDLMRTYNASPAQTFWKLRWPASMPYLFTSLKVAIAASLVGAIVGELPTGAVAGLGARLLAGSYYGQTVQIWAALFMAAAVAAALAGRRSSASPQRPAAAGAWGWPAHDLRPAPLRRSPSGSARLGASTNGWLRQRFAEPCASQPGRRRARRARCSSASTHAGAVGRARAGLRRARRCSCRAPTAIWPRLDQLAARPSGRISCRPS